jgi:hypothetical protein
MHKTGTLYYFLASVVDEFRHVFRKNSIVSLFYAAWLRGGL